MGILAGLLDMALVWLIYGVAAILVTSPIWGAVWYAAHYCEQKRNADLLQSLLESNPRETQDIAVQVRVGLIPAGTYNAKRWNSLVGAYRRFYPEDFFKYHQQGIL